MAEPTVEDFRCRLNRRGKVLLGISLFAIVIFSTVDTSDAGITFLTPPSMANKTYHAPEWICTQPPPTPATGAIFSQKLPQNPFPAYWLHTRNHVFKLFTLFGMSLSKIVSHLQLLRIGDLPVEMATLVSTLPCSTFQYDPRRGWYPPFTTREAYVERSLLDVASSLQLSGILVLSAACRVGSCAEILFADRSWCAQLGTQGITVLETGLIEGQDIPRLCENTTPSDIITVTLTSGDYNQWMAIKRGWYIVLFRIVTCLAAAAAASLALAKLIAYIKIEGPRANVPQIILWIQFVSSLFRTNLFALDPIYSGLIFNSVSAHMTVSIHLPFNFISLLLLAMYWSEILGQSKIYITSFLGKLRIPFIIASIFIVIVEIVTSLIRAIPALWRLGLRATIATAVSAIVYIIFALVISAFFFIFGIRVLRRVRESAKSYNVHGAGSENSASLNRITGLLVGSALFNALFLLGFILAAIDSFFWNPVGQTVGLTLIALGVLGSSITQVAAVKFPYTQDTGRKGGKTTAPTAPSTNQESSKSLNS